MSQTSTTRAPIHTAEVAEVPNTNHNITQPKEPQLTDQTRLLPPRQIIVVMFALSLCNLVTTLDQVVVSASLSTVAAAFNAGSVSAWIPAAYLMTSTAFQPLYGRLSDIFGRKAAIILAMGIYILGNLVAGFSKSIIQLIVFRAIAGVGDGGATSMVQIVVSDVVSLRDRGKFIGYAGAVTAAGYTIGPIIGGALAQHVSWRWTFWITLPVALFASIAILILLPLKPVQGDMRSKLLMIDYVGVFLTLAACTMIMLPLVWGGVTFPWKSAIVLGPLIAGIVAVGIFCLWESRVARLPLVPMYIFRHMTVVGVYICMFVNGFVFFSMLFYLPQFFQVILGYSSTRSGTFIIPLLVTVVSSAVGSGIWISRTGKYRSMIYLGFATFAIACGCMTIFTAETSRVVMVVLMVIAGLGIGATMQTTTVAAQASVERKDMAVVSAVRNFLRMLGGALALPSSAALLNNAMRVSMNTLSLPPSTISSIINNPSLLLQPSDLSKFGLTSSQADHILVQGYNKGFKDVFILNTALTVLAFVASVVMIGHKELLRGDEEALKQEAKAALMLEKAPGIGQGRIPEMDEDHGLRGDVEMGSVSSPER
ncbi:MFS general substrate transporter [Lentinula edodes]|uniref:major facilitator superfamily domain-containing protein n=1 Tax=Lentinula edodes TaxID=5353 RepID=UPI001E8EBE80|nr:major facilitator superfamily domain-containing protein [Lentinula edodes]KAH7870118.1 major facilitator superfamily domain-containing protein [Lentinula edodes]KAJ3902297.1 MFS general substrate transporter [Lentinula edodes]